MADAGGAVSLYAIAMRVARLDVTGAPIVGADNLYVSDSLVRVTYTPRYDETDAITKRNGRNRPCLNIPPRKSFAGLDLAIEVCEDDPALIELLQSGSVFTTGAGADVVGYQFPKQSDTDDHGFSLEFWTEAWHGETRDVALPYFWYAFPLCRVSQAQRQAGAEPDENVFEGTASANASWGNGPNNDWPHDSRSAGQWVRTATAPPAATNGYAATPPAA